MIMKHFLYTILIFNLLQAGILSAQPYQSLFGEESTMWIFGWNNLFGHRQDTIYTAGDTTINGESWRFLKCGNCLGQFGTALIKEDNETGKVYYREIYDVLFEDKQLDTSVILLFDFSLNTDDTFVYYNHFAYNSGQTGYGSITMNVSEVTYEDSKKIISLVNSPLQSPALWKMMEGIGSQQGIIPMHDDGAMIGMDLICHIKDNELFYSAFDGNCNIYSGSSTVNLLEAKDYFNIFPNPSKKILQIELKGEYVPEWLALYNLAGTLVLNKNFDQVISIKALPAGIYILKLYTATGLVFHHKVVKIAD